MKPRLILINGFGGSGKSAVARILRTMLKKNGFRVNNQDSYGLLMNRRTIVNSEGRRVLAFFSDPDPKVLKYLSGYARHLKRFPKSGKIVILPQMVGRRWIFDLFKAIHPDMFSVWLRCPMEVLTQRRSAWYRRSNFVPNSLQTFQREKKYMIKNSDLIVDSYGRSTRKTAEDIFRALK